MKYIKELNEISIKGLTLKDDAFRQWSTWIREGIKTIETRTWKTKYRGDILITCSKSSDSIYAGKAVCIVELYDIQKMIKEHEKEAMCNLYDNAYSWFFKNIRPIKPFDIKGRQGLFTINILEKNITYE